MAKAGGASIEEELYVEAWSDYLELDKSWTLQAFENATRSDLDPVECARRITVPGFRSALVRDTLRIIKLDGRIDPIEADLLRIFSQSLGLEPNGRSCGSGGRKEKAQLLGVFHELVLQTQPAVSHERLVRCDIHRIRQIEYFSSRTWRPANDRTSAPAWLSSIGSLASPH